MNHYFYKLMMIPCFSLGLWNKSNDWMAILAFPDIYRC